ncbi:hypothetical protein DMENIID0001_024870 [Sergentomyia squamirostris]
MTKKSSPRNKEWEKDRRDRLNKTFDNLAKKLPSFCETSPFSKIEILQKAIVFIESLQKKQNELLQSKCHKVLLKEREEFEQNITVLRYRNSQLADLLRQANITIPSFKAQNFVKNLSEAQIENLHEENNANGINTKPEKTKKYSNKLSNEQIDEARENEEKSRKKSKKVSTKTKSLNEKEGKKPVKRKSSKTKEKAAPVKKEELSVTAASSTSSVQTFSTILSYPEAQKSVKTPAICAISSKNVTITHTSLTTPIMATGFLPITVIQAVVPKTQVSDTIKITKRKNKGRWIQIRPQPTPMRIPFGKIPIPALRNTYAKKKKRVFRKTVRVKENSNRRKNIDDTHTIPEKRKSSDEKEIVEKKKSKLDEKKVEKIDKSESRDVKENPVVICKEKENEKFQKSGNEILSDHHHQEVSASLSHSDLSNDIFASLHVPSGGSGCLSPTAAFLMTFPVVSSAGGGKNPETTLSEESVNNPVSSGPQPVEKDQEVENSTALLDNLSSFFNTRDDYSSLYPSDNLEKSAQKLPDKDLSSSAPSNLIRIRTDMGATSQKTLDVQTSTTYSESTFSTFDYSCSGKMSTSVFTGYSNVALLPEITPAISTKSEFTFSLTKTTSTAPCTSYKADSLYNPFNLTTTSNNSTYSVAPTIDTTLSLPLPLNISSTIYPNVSDDPPGKTQGTFTFSLTNTTSTPIYYSKASTNLNISFPTNDSYNAYNPFSYNDPVGIKQSTDTGTNFSFCLTTTAAKTTPIYTSTSTSYNTLNPFSIDATLQSTNYRQNNYDSSKNYQFYPNQGQKTGTNQKQVNRGYQQSPRNQIPQQQQQKSPSKKTQNQQSKYHNVNWMTNSDYAKNNDFCIPPPLDFTHGANTGSFSYPPPPPPPTLGSIDLKSKSDVFFAHPPGEDNFSWSPNKLSNVLEPPSIHNYLPQAPLPTLHGDLALSTTVASIGPVIQDSGKDKTDQLHNYQDQHQQSGNFLSVSQLLVEQNKKAKKSKNIKSDDQSRKTGRHDKKQYPCMNALPTYADINYNHTSKGNQQQYSNIYSAESLIGYKKDRVSQQNYHQPTLDLPSTGTNLFPGIDVNNDINYNSSILFNPPTSSNFVPPLQNCMSVFPENDFYDYSTKSGVTKLSQQQNTYMAKSYQNNMSMDIKTAPSYANKYNTSQAPPISTSAKVKKTSSSKISDFYPPPPHPPPTIPNYDQAVSSANYFSVPLGVNSPHLPPAEDPFHLHHFNYSNPLKNLAPTNSTLYLPEGSSAPNSNTLTNFHLSSICPEINDKVRQQNW